MGSGERMDENLSGMDLLTTKYWHFGSFQLTSVKLPNCLGYNIGNGKRNFAVFSNRIRLLSQNSPMRKYML